MNSTKAALVFDKHAEQGDYDVLTDAASRKILGVFVSYTGLAPPARIVDLGRPAQRLHAIPYAYARASSRTLGLPRHVASTGKQTGNGDIFVDVLPVEAGAAELDAFALGRSRVQQTRKPRQWHAQGAAIAQFDPHRVLVKSNCRRRNAHAKPSRSGPGVL